MAKLISTVYVADPDRPGVSIQLDAGQEVPDHLAHLVTNPDAWEDGTPPAPAKKTAAKAEADAGTEDSAEETPSAGDDTKPARRRKPATGGS